MLDTNLLIFSISNEMLMKLYFSMKNLTGQILNKFRIDHFIMQTSNIIYLMNL